MINKLNDDIFLHIVNYLDIIDIYNLRLSYSEQISNYLTTIILFHRIFGKVYYKNIDI